MSPFFSSVIIILIYLSPYAPPHQQWLDGGATYPDNRSLSSPNNSDLSSGGGSPPLPQINAPPGLASSQNPEDEIIPTAIVIKNIPFNVKRETLLDIIVCALPCLAPLPLCHFSNRLPSPFQPRMHSTTT
jgi:hypothetical protein